MRSFLSLSSTRRVEIHTADRYPSTSQLLRLLIDSLGSRRRGREGGIEEDGHRRSGGKSGDAVGPHWLRLGDLAFLREETRGDLGSRPPLRRYGYAEVNDNGTSSSLPPLFSFLPPYTGLRFFFFFFLFLVFW